MGVLVAILVDLARLPTYFISFGDVGLRIGERESALVAFGTVCAFAGAYLGTRYLEKATVGVVRVIVAGLMLLIGVALALGIIGA